MALAHVQDCSAVVLATGSPLSAEITFPGNVTAGNTLVVFIALNVAATRSFTVSDDVAGSWDGGQIVSYNPYQGVAIWWKKNHPGGAVTITVTHGLASGAFYAGASEFSGLGSAPEIDATDSLYEGAAGNDHTCSVAGISSANECISLCSGVLYSLGTECNPGASYTEVTDGRTHNQTLFQWRYFAAGTGGAHTGPWSHTGTARKGLSVIAIISGTPVAPPTNMPVIASIYRRRFSS